jgi:hypothetical protein
MANYPTVWDETVPTAGEQRGTLGASRIRDTRAIARQRISTEHIDPSGSSGDALCRHIPGACTVLLIGTTAQIAGITGTSDGAQGASLALDITLGCVKYWTGSVWAVAPLQFLSLFTGSGGSPVHTHEDVANGGVATTNDHTHLSAGGQGGLLNLFGAWDTKALNTVYQATTDGFVSARIQSGDDWSSLSGLTDGSNPPTTVRTKNTSGIGAGDSGVSFPVRKGDYWKVTSTGSVSASSVYWLPIGG